MKQISLAGFFVLAVIATALYLLTPLANAQQSSQFKIEDAIILQDTDDKNISENPTQINQRRSTLLNKDGFSALVGETPMRLTVSNTVLNLLDSPEEIGKQAETDVKIIYTKDGGYALYVGKRRGSHTSTVFNTTGCAMGKNICFTTLAQPWIDNSVTGFGYRLDGPDRAQDFVNSTYFRPFSLITTQAPAGSLVAEGQGREHRLRLGVRLNQMRGEQGSFTQPIVISVLNDW